MPAHKIGKPPPCAKLPKLILVARGNPNRHADDAALFVSGNARGNVFAVLLWFAGH